LGDVATTAPENTASNSVPSADAHLSVAFEDMFLSLPGITARLMVSGDLEPYGSWADSTSAEDLLRSG
jgi:hypothetical protein